jgi:hypothetical protein
VSAPNTRQPHNDALAAQPDGGDDVLVVELTTQVGLRGALEGRVCGLGGGGGIGGGVISIVGIDITDHMGSLSQGELIGENLSS